MSSKSIIEKEPDAPLPDWTPTREAAPSVMQEDQPSVARILGLTGLFFIVIGSAVMATVALGKVSRINPGFGIFSSVLGVALLLFHASRDTDRQIRRSYGLLGYLWIVAGILVIVLSIRGSTNDARFLPYGFTLFTLGYLFLMPFARNETEIGWRMPALIVLGGLGTIFALVGFVWSNLLPGWVLPYGVLLTLLGLFYLWAFIGLSGTSTDLGYYSGLGLGALGALFFLIALGRSVITPLVTHGGGSYLTAGGAILMGLGLLYASFSAGLCSDNRLVVLTRRELAGFFYSPIAYVVFFGMTVVGWLVYWMFVDRIVEFSSMRDGMMEPIVQGYVIHFFTVVAVMGAVMVITMRLLSEEQRTGTLEVLLTAPLGEVAVVLSKFFAALIFYMVMWMPWALFLVALRVAGQQAFDYRPLISFFVALFVTGAGFLSMGLFFSSLSRNQIVAAVLCFMGMSLLVAVYFVKFLIAPGNPWAPVLNYVSFIDLWFESLKGRLAPRFVLFHLSAAVFWLFLTVKVLESRKWK